MASTSNPASTLTSKYLHSRISFLTTTLIKRFENILALSLDDTDLSSTSLGNNDEDSKTSTSIERGANNDEADVNTKEDNIHRDDDGNGDGSMRVGVEKMSDTKAMQLQIQIETAGLVRAAEEVLGLSRGIKEVWAYGDFSVDREVGRGGKDGDREQERVMEGEKEEEEAALIEEEGRVKRELEEFLDGWYRRQRQQQQQSTVEGGGEDEKGGEMEGQAGDDDREGMDTG